MTRPSRRYPALAALLGSVLCGIIAALPARAFDSSKDFEVALAFPQFPLRGASQTFGMVIWTNPCSDTDNPAPPLAMSLAAHGWDVVKLSCNPAFNKTWFATIPKLVGIVADQARNAAQLGYRNVILGGVGAGGGLSLEAAAKVPVFGVIAMAPNIGQSVYFPADKSAERIISDLGAANMRRSLLVMPPDDEALPGFNQAGAARPVMTGRGIPYLMVDSQVHGHFGGYSRQMLPYAACAAWFFAPQAQVRPGEFHCLHDEAMTVLQSLNMNPGGVAHLWMGYNDGTGQPVVIAEHPGGTVDIGMGSSIDGKGQARAVAGFPAVWAGNVLTISISPTETTSLQPNPTPPYWSYRHMRGASDWTATLALIAGR